MPDHHHRSGQLKQANKKNKRSKSSKRSATRGAGGKVNRTRGGSQKALFAESKADRRNKLQQKRDYKREALLQKKRGVSGGLLPPRVIGIISLAASEEIEGQVRTAILEGADKTARPLASNKEATVSCKFDVHKKDGSLTVLTNSTAFRGQYGHFCDDTDGAIQAALDLCRVCDMVVFVVDGDGSNIDDDLLEMQIGGDDSSTRTSKSQAGQNWDHLISERGDRILSAIKGQGMPSLLTLLARTEVEDPASDFMSVKSSKSIRRTQTKRALNLKRYVNRFASTEFGPNNNTVLEVDLSYMNENDDDIEEDTAVACAKRTDVAALVRTICTKAASPSKWVSQAARPYILSDSHQYSATTQELKLSGFIRGRVPFNVNSLIHVPGLGTYACKSMEMSSCPLFRRNQNSMEASESKILVSDPTKRESLERFATPDALEGEQNLVGFDEDEDAHEMDGAGGEDDKNDFSRPTGWSDYQSAWLDAVDDVDGNDDFDRGELAKELNKKSSDSVAANIMDIDDANDVTPEERRLLKEQRRKEQAEDLEFPDEVQVDEDILARDRFARYRSLKSFRKTYWDPKESLPDSYGSVFHFSNFKATQRSVMADMRDLVEEAASAEGKFGLTADATTRERQDTSMGDGSDDDDDCLEDCAPAGSYVTMTIEAVSPSDAKLLSTESLITAVGLLPHENKVSVLHAGLCQSTGCNVDAELPVKSKDVLTLRCGWRTWKARPVFSQNNLNCGKHKFERFMPPNGAFFAASFFGPVSYTPCPVLVFREQTGKPQELCAIGSMLGADADRTVVKRIVLTGYPTKVHKRHAVVKYMFYNPEDVKWFKPAGLTTKHGLQGNIVQSVGEHGTMKCLFNQPISQADTVICALYKRIYPKYYMGEANDPTESGAKSIRPGVKPELIVR